MAKSDVKILSLRERGERVVVVAREQDEEPEAPLVDRVRMMVDEHNQQVATKLCKWVVYWVDHGVRRLWLDDCPGIHRDDFEFAVDWFRSEGFVVTVPRFWGRITIEIGRGV